jgi:hypothetical protein
MGDVQQLRPPVVADAGQTALCFHCRRVPPDRHLRCVNPRCDRHGQAVCTACAPDVPVTAVLDCRVKVAEGRRVRTVSAEVIWTTFGVILIAAITAGAYFEVPWWASVVGGLAFGGGVAAWLASQTEYRRGVYGTVAESLVVGHCKLCPACWRDAQPA